MTLRLRNILLIIFTAFSAACLVFTVKELISSGSFTPAGILQFLPVLFIAFYAAVSCIVIFFSFRNTVSSEIYFFFIFIFSTVFDIFRSAGLSSNLLPLFSVYSMVPTRLVYYGLFAGALALFCSGLFTTGLEYQKIGVATVIILALPAALVIVLPVDLASAVPGGTWEIGRFYEITIALAVFQLLGVLNFIIAGIRNESREYSFIAAALLIAVCARALIFYFENIFAITAGFLLLIAGTILFADRTHKLYLWD